MENPTQEETLDIIIEFVEAAIHFILYIRNVYPAELFDTVKLYGVPTKQARHPELVGYIQDLLDTIKPDLKKGRVSKIFVGIKLEEVIEKYSIAINHMHVDLSERGQLNMTELSTFLRSFLLKLSCLDSTLLPLPNNVTWNVWVEINGEDPTPLNGVNLVPTASSELNVKEGKIIPLKSMDAKFIKIEMYVEEGMKSCDFSQ
ncbi:MAD2 mitotic arrest deficient-like 2 [Terramyces sp. JEL0728]|nr:MAD2 mitotic arrest deficient-like 2 [Terramyces sp. JEL0728]